ncbi:anti-sigma regulatory factor (Ser/Thr protein kinase) [Asanoa ferruginea]|uniref:Anti-sigma regulatory factor (Ser/Thr protein kinase) n=1 Tax=Asanoa ferruginea TaxID=53367 RepID=A0A3D9ZGB2_9ACTN|nr:SpoIIE family protein phosphatase [Asanoa ferruginea]REF94913.1 anti-sigma regulatory factor (Ser/Thr protein kinase) [Asanoa ferruginea]GIF45507.1 transcriptional regulator [Asanoa ferruginea]
MGAVAVSRASGLIDGGLWFRLDDASAVSAVRRAAQDLGTEVGLGTGPLSGLAIVAAELASNLVKHADDGRLLVRRVRSGDLAGVELLAVDAGPGMADVARSSRDGHSTTGTLGIGLGAIVRQAGWLDMSSVEGRGTVAVAQVWPGQAPEPATAAAVSRAMSGEEVCGDGYAIRLVAGRTQVLVSDGLGHGPLAAAAAAATVQAFQAAPADSPAGVVEHVHRSVRHTRGAAIAVAQLDEDQVRFAGLGNIAGFLVDDTARRGLVSLPGIAGHQRRAVREFSYPAPPGALLVMHSDGVVDRWLLDNYPGLRERAPQLVAATLLRDAGTRRDDACVLVARAGR